jgi:hypothetical protein
MTDAIPDAIVRSRGATGLVVFFLLALKSLTCRNQMTSDHFAKAGVEGSNPFSRSQAPGSFEEKARRF